MGIEVGKIIVRKISPAGASVLAGDIFSIIYVEPVNCFITFSKIPALLAMALFCLLTI